jgi:hypothetical protein
MDIKDVFAKFEEEDYIGAKTDLQAIIKAKTNDYLKTNLELSEDPIQVAAPEGDAE